MCSLQKKRLMDTLRLAGIEGLKEGLLIILSHGYSKESIKNTHTETNNKIQESLKSNSLGKCIHITGEMRALTDPFHRYLCEEINHKERDVFRVVYNLPEENMNNSTKMLKWNLESWALDKSNRKWDEELRTIYSIANRSVNLYALDTSDEIQYSVFGHKYILLQEKHKDRASRKHTWLLESEAVNSILTDKAENIIGKSKDIDGSNYRDFTKRINSIVSMHFLSMLIKTSHISVEDLLSDEMANDFTDSPIEIIEALSAMGFIRKTNNSELIEISISGREFIK